MSKLEYHKAIITDVIDETPSVKRFFLEFPDLEAFDFKAGQYVKVNMPIEDKKTYRQYSIASEPVGDNRIELLIVLNPVGKGTHYLFNVAKVGTELEVSRALGRFVLPENIEKEVCFICTGVGLAPFRSMYLDVLNKNKDSKDIRVIFGTRSLIDMCYADEMTELDKKHNRFHYHPVLSREDSPSWKGEKGYVHKIYQHLYKGDEDVLFYLCGWDAMIKEARKNLIEMGFPKREILFEKYD